MLELLIGIFCISFMAHELTTNKGLALWMLASMGFVVIFGGLAIVGLASARPVPAPKTVITPAQVMPSTAPVSDARDENDKLCTRGDRTCDRDKYLIDHAPAGARWPTSESVSWFWLS
jgi:hypothetical protein